MTHEPECQQPLCGQRGHTEFDRCACEWCICDELRAAYQRGREDAAKAVESVIDYLNSMKMPTTPSWTLWESQLISGCIALARGGGERSE